MNKITIYNRSDGKDIPINQQLDEPKFVPAKCYIAKKGFLIKFIKDKDIWIIESAFTDGSAQGSNHSYSTSPFTPDAKISTKGFVCPFCGIRDYTQCTCGRITCWDEKVNTPCAFCGNTSKPTHRIKTYEVVSDKKKEMSV